MGQLQGAQGGSKRALGVDMFIILMVAMVSQLYTYVKTHLVVRFRYMYLTYYTSIMSQHWNKKKNLKLKSQIITSGMVEQ